LFLIGTFGALPQVVRINNVPAIVSAGEKGSMSKTKLFLFSLIAITLMFSLLELAARVFLSFNMRSGRFLLYGLVDTEKEKLRIIRGPNGRMLYCEGIPSQDKRNPVNSLGFRGEEIRKEKGTIIRVVCLGSSTTYGTGLDYDETYPKLLQDKLHGMFGEGRFEVINAGQPGLRLMHIIELVKNKIIPLSPDIVILMNLNNNLEAPGFSFVGINEENGAGWISKVKSRMVKRLALGSIVHGAVVHFIGSPVAQFFRHFDWQGFSKALLSPDNIWQARYEKNCHALIESLRRDNPGTRIILADEAFNYDLYPPMAAPYERAREILRRVSFSAGNVRFLSVHPAIASACQAGEKVWQDPAWDPLHLSRRGNEILADLTAKEISSILQD
jgi:lysophospholipase L1-like esterase